MKIVSKVFKRVTAAALSALLVFGSVPPVQVHADDTPTTTTRDGVALLVTMLLGSGLRFVGQYDTVVAPGLERLWDDFTAATGNTVGLAALAAGSSMYLGYLRVSSSVKNAVTAFQSWYQSTYSQPATGDVTVPVLTAGVQYLGITDTWQDAYYKNGSVRLLRSDSSYGDYTAWRVVMLDTPAGMFLYGIIYPRSVTTYPLRGKSADCNAQACTFPIGHQANNATEETFMYNGYAGVAVHIGPDTGDTSLTSLSVPVFSAAEATALTAFSHTYGDTAIADRSMTGQSLDLVDGYDITQDQAALLDISALNALVNTLGDTVTSVQDLVDSIPLIYDHTWSDVPAYADTPADTIPWVDVPASVQDLPVPDYVPEVPADRDSYKVLGLADVFPFSIPGDVYYLFKGLVSAPVAPAFDLGIVEPVSGNLLTYRVDLAPFDGVAQIFRLGELLLLCLGLILVTRDMIRG